ncbi:Kinesin-like protein [Paramicrosporidium saccamoebae]|uniref:Kinesin-like protein n=1 Tax=Paramicrosporidium saccamoebae TaxID=1246581 RepID=A0A2H9TLZ7_9FUNG|nr:Kinesin-like protein [Paramicrosporidium saccamoebae]
MSVERYFCNILFTESRPHIQVDYSDTPMTRLVSTERTRNLRKRPMLPGQRGPCIQHSNMAEEVSGKINVAIRFRPLSEREVCSGNENAWNLQENDVILASTGLYRNYSSCQFHFVVDNEKIYESSIENLTAGALQGVNGTVFAYGQTSAGKTFTMLGTEPVVDSGPVNPGNINLVHANPTPNNPGLVNLGIAHVFRLAREASQREYSIRVSYLEIYNETIRDLLCAENDNLRIHESLTRGVFVGNLTEEPVTSEDEALAFVKKGEEFRHVGETHMNERSSRSHTIFRICSSRDSHAGPVLAAALTFVDLAGSEKARLTGAEGLRLKEGGHINKSLLALTLSYHFRTHIPYRDSKLTRILQSSLGGNANTAIICAVTPASDFIEETLSTLKFASRAKIVTNKPRVNEYISDQELLRKAQEEVKQLKEELFMQASEYKRFKVELCDSSNQTDRLDCVLLEQLDSLRSELTNVSKLSKLLMDNDASSIEVLKNGIEARLAAWKKGVLFTFARYVTEVESCIAEKRPEPIEESKICTECESISSQLTVLEECARNVDSKLERLSLALEASRLYDDARDRIQTLELLVHQREEEVSSLLEKVRQTQHDAQSKQQDWEVELARQKDKAEDLDDQVQRLTEELGTTRDNQASVTNSLNTQLEELVTENGILSASLVSVKEQLEATLKQEESDRASFLKISLEKDEQDEIITHNQCRIGELETERDQLTDAIKAMTDALFSEKESKKALQSQLDSAERDSLKSQISQLSSTVEAMTDKLLLEGESKKGLQSQNDRLNELVDRLSEIVETMKCKLSQEEESAKTLQGQHDRLSEIVETLKCKLSQEEESAKALQGQNGRLSEIVETLKCKLSQEEESAKKLQSQLDNTDRETILRIELEKLRDVSAKKSRRFELIISDLEEQVLHLKNAMVLLSRAAGSKGTGLSSALPRNSNAYAECKEKLHTEYAKSYPLVSSDLLNGQDYDWLQFWEVAFKVDNPRLYNTLLHTPVVGKIIRENLHTKIIEHNASAIFSSLDPIEAREVAMAVDLIIKHAPEQVIRWIVFSVHDLVVDTRYKQLPGRCLRTKYDQPEVHGRCAPWLAKRNCLSLMKQMFRDFPYYSYDYKKLEYIAINKGSLDVLQWLVKKGKIDCLCLDSVNRAVDRGQLEVVKWALATFEHQIDWGLVAKNAYHGRNSHKIMKYFHKHTKFPLSFEGTVRLLAANGNLDKLKCELKNSKGTFPWNIVTKYAAQDGHIHVLEWANKETKEKILPTASDLEGACMNGHFIVLCWISVLKQDLPYKMTDYAVLYLYKAAQSYHQETMDWILSELLGGLLPPMAPMYNGQKKLREDVHLRVLKWITLYDAAKIEPIMMLKAAEFGHEHVVKWLIPSKRTTQE